MRKLGLLVTPEERASNLKAADKYRREFRLTKFPPRAFSWLDQKMITPVRDQLECGSCVSFGTLAAVEACILINKKIQKDLSEAYLFRKGGGSCGQGWTFKPALKFMQLTGTVDEVINPYTVPLPKILPVMDKASHTKILRWQQLLRNTAAKLWLSQVGPVITGMDVYADFFDYKGGIYRAQSDDLQGGHCVCIVGYDDVQGCWICKNSWGEGWGENGFFRIAYDQAIGLAFGFFGVKV